MHLDFSQLSDDQLVDLIRAACAEAGQRSVECAAAAKNAMLDEAEKARIAREVIERERSKSAREEAGRIARQAIEQERAKKEAEARKAEEERVAKTWEYKEEIGAQVSAILKPTRKAELKVWTKGADKRIYIGGGYNDNDAEYYHTGNHKEKPRTLKFAFSEDIAITKEMADEAGASLTPILEGICEKWNNITIPIPAYVEPQTENQEAA